jgi:hypothetical protein
MSIEYWMKPTVDLPYPSSSGVDIFDKGDAYVGWLCVDAANPDYGKLVFTLCYSTDVYSATSFWASGAWYHLAFTYDGSNMRLYVNGVLENTVAKTGNVHSSGFPLSIGSYTLGTFGFFRGILDEFAIYNYARTETEIQNDYARAPSKFFLHGGASLDNNSPTATTAKYKDSPSIKFSGGNPWKEIGIWAAAASLTDGRLEALGDLDVWLGLKNSDDQGTNFDLRAEVYKDGVLVASGETYLIKGVTRNPDRAMKVTVSLGSFSPVEFDGVNDALSLRILTRIGTDGNGNFGGGHSSAVGLRLYFDAIIRPAMLAVIIA